MFDVLLIANRGEIARRIIRTCRRLGIASAVVFSDADADEAFVAEADLAVGIGGAAPADSYLRGDRIVEAALRVGAGAVHPGYGFLSENAAFARQVAGAGMTFVGPSPEVIAAMGSKIEAKERMAAAGVPVLASAVLAGDADLDAVGADVGFPLLVKASAGGGGRGMRRVEGPADLADAVRAAGREAESAFGDGTLYAERYLSPSRHVEVQILGDSTGRVVHLGERDCSVQRRHQKIVEEAPSPLLTVGQRETLLDAAVRAGEAIGYTNAGTVEFICGPDGDIAFLEVNTRLQVEHPVTEAVTGLDLVELQIEIAAGGEAPDQDRIPAPQGHAIEARLYAEDPTQDFRPSTGTVHELIVGDEARVDSAIDGAGRVSQHYDAMIAKLVVHAGDRRAAARRLARAVARTHVAGVAHNGALLHRILTHPEFLDGGADTSFLTRHDPATLGRPLVEGKTLDAYLAAAALAESAANRAEAPVQQAVRAGFRNVPTARQTVTFDCGGSQVEVAYRIGRSGLSSLAIGDRALAALLWSAAPGQVDVTVEGVRRAFRVGSAGDLRWVIGPEGAVDLRLVPRFAAPEEAVPPGSLVASMPGTVRHVAVETGSAVSAGQLLVVVEAMKMEISVTAPTDGTVAEVSVSPGDAVEAGSILAVVDSEPT